MQGVKPSLREEFRTATRHRIADAALDLVGETGTSGLRADAIAERAGVSRRTFFNYVATTEAALSIPAEDYLAAAHRHFVARPAGEDLVTSMIAAIRQIEPDIVARFGRMLRLAGTAPSFHGPGLEAWDRYEQAVRDVIAERLPGGTDPLYAAAVAAAVMGAGRAAARAWSAQALAGGAQQAGIADYLARALRYLTTFADAGQDSTTWKELFHD
jgi:AcrR family transcriptional regulator